MTKHTAKCPECGQDWHAWAERPDCPCPDCVARARFCTAEAWTVLGIVSQIGTLTFVAQA